MLGGHTLGRKTHGWGRTMDRPGERKQESISRTYIYMLEWYKIYHLIHQCSLVRYIFSSINIRHLTQSIKCQLFMFYDLHLAFAYIQSYLSTYLYLHIRIFLMVCNNKSIYQLINLNRNKNIYMYIFQYQIYGSHSSLFIMFLLISVQVIFLCFLSPMIRLQLISLFAKLFIHFLHHFV